jgi:hypothetical protein
MAEKLNTEILHALSEEIFADEGLLQELNEHFAAMEGVQDATEFSRSLTFFCLGAMWFSVYGSQLEKVTEIIRKSKN